MIGIDDIIDFIDNLPIWQKWLGTSIIGVLLFFLLMLITAGPETTGKVASIPAELKQVESNVTQTYIRDTKGPVLEIIGDFWRTGNEQAEGIRDPASAKVVKYSWLLLGLYIGAVIMFVPLYAIYKTFRRIL